MLAGLLLLMALAPAPAAPQSPKPVLLRWSFWVAPERKAEFAAAFDEQLAPLLARHGLVDPAPDPRVTPDSVFSRIFAVATRAEMDEGIQAVQSDSAWQELMGRLGAGFGEGGRLRNEASLYRHPAGKGRTVPAGPGKVVPAGPGRGHWKTYDVLDGMGALDATCILQDRSGSFWFGTYSSGVTRYDGVNFRTFTVRDGLAGQRVSMAVEDRSGNLWFGTEGGVSRYDGQGFRSFTVADGLGGNQPRGILEDRRGDIWISTVGGLSRYDGQGLATYTTEHGLAHDNVGALLEDRAGRLWVGTESGVSLYEGGEPVRFSSIGPVREWATRFFEDRDGNVWVGTWRHIARFDGREWEVFTGQQGALPLGYVTKIIQDREGNVWVGTFNAGVHRYDGRDWKTFSFPGPNSRVLDILQDGAGTVWLSTGGGLRRYDGQTFTVLTTEDGLANNAALTLFEDRGGYLWIATLGGTSRYDDRGFGTFTSQHGLGGDWATRMLADQRGDLWLAMFDSVVSRYDGRSFTSYSAGDGLPSMFGQGAMAQDRQGNLWFGTQEGVTRYDGQQFTTFTADDGLAHNLADAILQDRRGHLWFATRGGLCRYDGDVFETFTVADGLPTNLAWSVLEDRQGNLWFAHTPNGLSRYDGMEFVPLGPADGLPSDWIRALFEDRDGNLWFGTDGYGVIRYDGQHFATFTTQDGLAHAALRAICQDRKGHLWFGTDGGVVSRFDGRVFQTLSRLDGLNGQSVRAIAQDEQGDMWFCTFGGVTRYHPREPVPPGVFLDAVVADRRYDTQGQVSIPSTVDLAAFEFHGSSFTTSHQQLVYLYRLRGFEPDWRQTRQRRVEYSGLPPGDYVFEVQAVDRDLVYSDTAAVALEVYYQPAYGSLAVDDLQLEDLFASFYRGYAERPVGSVLVTNSDPNPVEAVLRLQVPDWMRRPCERRLTLEPGSSQRLALLAPLDPEVLALREPTRATAEVSLSFMAGAQTVSLPTSKELTIHGRGALRWAGVAPAAAFITPGDPGVAAFARTTLVAFQEQSRSLGRPAQGLLQAMVLFEALKVHGVRYIADASQPYGKVRADAQAVDHVQYPAETLLAKAGDCDDLTVLYGGLLESAGIPTALVDSPEHIYLLFDSGLARWEADKLPVDPRLCVALEERVWIPVEITLLDRSFLEAWAAGAQEVARLSGMEQRRLVVVTSEAWKEYLPAAPLAPAEVAPPPSETYSAAVSGQRIRLEKMIEDGIRTTYLDPLKADPGDAGLRTRLLKVHVALRQFDEAISAGLDFLIDDRGDRAVTDNHVGIAYYLKGEVKQAAYYFQQALALSPQDEGIQRNLSQALWALGRTETPVVGASLTVDAADPLKGAQVDEESFYWVK